MKSGGDGPRRDPQDPSDLGCRKPDVVGQDEHGAVLDGELEKSSLQLVAVRELGEVVPRLLTLHRKVRQLDGTPASTADLVVAGVDEESVEPGVEGTGVAETPKLPPGLDDGVLDGIFRGIPIAKDPKRDRVEAVVCGGRKGIECLVVAPLCAFDEIGRQRRLLGCGAATAALKD